MTSLVSIMHMMQRHPRVCFHGGHLSDTKLYPMDQKRCQNTFGCCVVNLTRRECFSATPVLSHGDASVCPLARCRTGMEKVKKPTFLKKAADKCVRYYKKVKYARFVAFYVLIWATFGASELETPVFTQIRRLC